MRYLLERLLEVADEVVLGTKSVGDLFRPELGLGLDHIFKFVREINYRVSRLQIGHKSLA